MSGVRIPAEYHRIPLLQKDDVPLRFSKERIWLYGATLAVVNLVPLLSIPGFFIITANQEDWGNFWAAGATVGTKALLDPTLHSSWQLARHMRPQFFAYPPGVAWFYLPSSHLLPLPSYFADQALMTAVSFVCAWLISRIYRFPIWFSIAAVFAWGPLLDSIVVGQSTPVALALFLIAISGLIKQRQTVTGLATGALLFKPSDAVVLLPLLLLGRQWQALGLAVALAGGWFLLSVAATGGEWNWPVPYVHMLQSYYHSDFSVNAVKSFTLPTVLMYLGASERYAMIAAAVLLIVGLALIARRPAQESANIAPLLTLAVSPHAWPYDVALLIPTLCYVMRTSVEPWRTRVVATAYVIAVLPGIHFDPLAILVLGGTVLALWHRGQKSRAAAPATIA